MEGRRGMIPRQWLKFDATPFVRSGVGTTYMEARR